MLQREIGIVESLDQFIRKGCEIPHILTFVEKIPYSLEPEHGKRFVITAVIGIRRCMLVVEPVDAVAHHVLRDREWQRPAIVDSDNEMGRVRPLTLGDGAVLESFNKRI